jgi:hypothetical protein
LSGGNWICKRNPGDSIEMDLGYVNTVKLVRVIDGKHAWLAINGETHGPLAAGDEIVMGGETAILLAIVRFKGQEVTIGVNASKEVKLRAIE